MLRQALILFALACCFVLAPSTGRPSSAWADTVVTVGSGSGSGVAVAPAKDSIADKASEDMLGTGKQIVADIKGSNWREAVAGFLALLFAFGVRFAPRLFGQSDRGKAAMIMTLALLVTLSAALATSTPLSPGLFVGAISTALLAIGGRQWISRILWPQDGGAQIATWLQPVLGVKPKS